MLKQLAIGGSVGVINFINNILILLFSIFYFGYPVLSKNLMYGYLMDIRGFLMDFKGISDQTDIQISGFMLYTTAGDQTLQVSSGGYFKAQLIF